MGAGPHNTYAQWSQPMFGSAEVADFKALDPDVTLVMNGQYAASAIRSEMLCVEDRCLAGIASKSNISISRVAGCRDAYEFFVDSTPHIDGTARTHGVCGMLNGAPRCRLGAGIRISPGRRHVEGGVGLAEGLGDAYKKNNKGQNSHARPPNKSTVLASSHRSSWPHFSRQIS